MLLELDPESVIAYLKRTQRLSAGDVARAELLAWGVSNVVLRINVEEGDDFVIKQSREKLRTEAAWTGRLDRIWREADVMRTLAQLLPAGVIPQVLFEDRENFLFAMQAVREDHVVWKESLLKADLDFEIARKLGNLLSTFHRETAGDAELRDRFGDTEIFDELRVDPFYRQVAAVHPDIASSVNRLIDETLATSACLVHGDFSPKNILIDNHKISLVDFETGHYGDPAFDLGFFLSHLLLKTVLHSHRCTDFVKLASTFWTHYVGGPKTHVQTTKQDPKSVNLERRTVQHLAGCMLARIDGKSPVDYLRNESDRDFVRRFCRGLFLDPPTGLFDAFGQLTAQLESPPQPPPL